VELAQRPDLLPQTPAEALERHGSKPLSAFPASPEWVSAPLHAGSDPFWSVLAFALGSDLIFPTEEGGRGDARGWSVV